MNDGWIKLEDKKPPCNKIYRVRDQYGDTNDSYWDGEYFQGKTNPKGSLMLYADSRIVEWRDENEEIKIIIHPPEGQEFSICIECKNPCIKHESEICLWCTLLKIDGEGYR